MKLRSDLFARLNNGQQANLSAVEAPYSRFSVRVLQVLQEQGFISHWHLKGEKFSPIVVYFKKKSFKSNCLGSRNFHISQVSGVGRPFYVSVKSLWRLHSGVSMYIVSTSRGLLSDRQARKYSLGGELVCKIS